MEEGEEKVAPAITRNRFDEILTLLDLYWFHHLILLSTPPPTPPPALSGLHAEPQPLSSPIRHRRTRSNESISTFFPRPVKPPRLQTIPSGKVSLNTIESSQLHLADMDTINRERPPKNRHRRSMSELELEELKGLMDLGFNFSDTEVERDPKIADIVPGLRKRRSEGEVKVARGPYLSEAWRFIDGEERRRVLRDWSVLTNGDEKHVKEQLRRWAHVVASTVR
ncbi:hypothetical protein FCM35_KLT01017 [Carex littledalei]|uniref:Uncharacterized protein n=1 Tax=Carex littledalei TaxID=544730 RepID=A0A833VC33_9POAL|nr:hypothetical protein FCM35_KLT01017 [Carex littledalei]